MSSLFLFLCISIWRYLLWFGWEFVAQQTGTSGGVGRLHCNSYSNAFTVFPKEIVLCSHFYFCFFLCAMQCCVFLSVSQWHGLSTNDYTNSKSVNVNLVQSLAINLLHTLRCNLQFAIIVFKTFPPEYTVILTTWLRSLIRTMPQGLVILMALAQIFTFERWTKDFEQETGFCR